MNRLKKAMSRILVFTTVSFLVLSLPVYAQKEPALYDSERITEVAAGIVQWKTLDNGASGCLMNTRFLACAGTTQGDWFPIGMSRLGIADDYDGYLAVIKDIVQKRYQEPGRLSAAKATEWHRISLAVLAMGGDPTALGTEENGQPINLIADGTYQRGKTAPLGRQGINGPIWGLISLDSKRYEVPEDAYNTREDMILEILRQQLSDGGFALSGEKADPDITAMALQALSPYYNDEKMYSYTQKVNGNDVCKTVRQVVDDSLVCLSKRQLPTGNFESWGTENVESTDQVTIALCSLGIHPQTDKRFIKNGNTLVDGILRYRMKDGGFRHSFTYEEENPTSLANQSNTMASEQTLCTMAAIVRQMQGQRTLYDFRPEQSTALKERIELLGQSIDKLSEKTNPATLETLLKAFYSIPENERSYVRNYWVLSDKAKKAGISIETIAGKTPIVENPRDPEEFAALLCFSDADKKAVDELAAPFTTEQHVLVTKLLEKLNNAEAFHEKSIYLEKLQTASAEIARIQAEIESINAAIVEKLYPFESLSLKDKPVIDALVKRYHALSDDDKTKIDRWEDVVKAQTTVNALLRAGIISAVLVIVVAALAIFVCMRIRARKRKKQAEMDELSALYEEEE